MANTFIFDNDDTGENNKYVFLEGYYEVFRDENFMFAVGFNLHENKSVEEIKRDLINYYLDKGYRVTKM